MLSLASFSLPYDLALPSIDFYDSGATVACLFVKINEAVYGLGVGAQNENVRRVVLVVAFPPTDAVNPSPCVVGLVDSPKARNFLTVLPSHGSFLHLYYAVMPLVYFTFHARFPRLIPQGRC